MQAARLCAALAAALLAASPAAADTLLDNVNGISIARDGAVTRFDAMTIRDDGIILQIFERGEKPPSKVDYRIDGDGKTVIPGLVDSHVRLMDTGFAAIGLDLSATASLAEAQAKIADYGARYPDRPWIVGTGWDQANWAPGRLPTAAELDAAVADRPVWLTHRDGTAGWANSRALELAGIDADSADPEGGRIVRQGGSKAPAGVLIGNAMQAVSEELPRPRPEDRDRAFLAAQDLLIRRGITAVADMGTTIEDWQSYRRAGDAGNLRLRIMAYSGSVEDMMLIAGPQPTPWLYEDRLRMIGLRLVLDGSLDTRSAWLKTPYTDDPQESGLTLLDHAQLRNLMSRAAMDGFQVAVQASGDGAVDEALAAIEEIAEAYRGERRWRIEAAQLADPLDFTRFGNHGIVASMQPLQQTANRDLAETRLGAARLTGAYAWRSIHDAGAALSFGSGAPERLPDPIAGIAAAATREDESGQLFGGWHPQETLRREQALAAYTAGGAYAGFGEGRFGRLAVGERADFLMIDRDALLSSMQDLRDTKLLQVWINGRLAYSNVPADADESAGGDIVGR